MRTTTKEVKHDVNGDEMSFQLRKMDALSGTFMMKFCIEKLVPLWKIAESTFAGQKEDQEERDDEEVAAERTAQFMDMLPKLLEKISMDELISFETMCLQNIFVLKPAGWQQVMVGKNIVIEEIKTDSLMVLLLCFDYVLFEFADFFGGSGLGSILSQKLSSLSNA